MRLYIYEYEFIYILETTNLIDSSDNENDFVEID